MIPGDHGDEQIELRMVPFSRLIELERWFEDPELHYLCVRIEERNPMSLVNRLFLGQHVMVWDIIPVGSTESRGYAVLNWRVRARPNIYAFFFDGNFDVELAKCATALLVKTIFDKSAEVGIDYYMPIDIDQDFYNYLLEIGFTSVELDDVDPEIERALVIDRAAYSLYHTPSDD